MTPPKEPKAWRRPRLYFCDVPEEWLKRIADLRIIYPNGKTERSMVGEYEPDRFFNEDCLFHCCWQVPHWGNPRGESQRRKMLNWAEQKGIKIEFIGEL